MEIPPKPLKGELFDLQMTGLCLFTPPLGAAGQSFMGHLFFIFAAKLNYGQKSSFIGEFRYAR